MEIFGINLSGDLTSDLTRMLQDYGVWVVTLCIFLESFGAPVPAETLLITTAALASQGKLSLPPLLFASWVGAVMGDNVGYLIGRYGGRALVIRFGKRFFITEERLHKVEAIFRKYGGRIVLFARFFTLLRQLNGVVAGTSNMPWWRFLLFNALGAAMWVGVWGLGSFWFGEHLKLIEQNLKIVGPILILAAAVGIGAYIIYRRRERP
ncbi:MAG: DedA family protein [Pseudomonadota bacterium]